MWDVLADVVVAIGEAPVRELRANRVERRLASGQPVRIPCSARSERPGWPARYTAGSLLLSADRSSIVFLAPRYGQLEFLTGGVIEDTEPEERFGYEFLPSVYWAPGGGPEIHFLVHHRYHSAVQDALA